jgi:hypothetical protein
MKKVLVLLTLFVAVISIVVARAQTRTMSWSPVTTYDDGTLIEAGNTVSYSAWRQDNVTKTNVQIANHITATSTTFDDASLVKGRVYNFTAMTHVASGGDSVLSPIYAFRLPLGKASPPAAIQVPGWDAL